MTRRSLRLSEITGPETQVYVGVDTEALGRGSRKSKYPTLLRPEQRKLGLRECCERQSGWLATGQDCLLDVRRQESQPKNFPNMAALVIAKRREVFDA